MNSVLFLTTQREDYLQDQLLLGLRQILQEQLVDFPKKDVMYVNCQIPRSDLYGRGFTIWKLLDDLSIRRDAVESRVFQGEFDLVVFGSIQRQRDLFRQCQQRGWFQLKDLRFAFIDGEDHTRCFRPALTAGAYYKREHGWWTASGAKEISFSIPSQKVRPTAGAKTKTFARHVQCPEAFRLPEVKSHCRSDYPFTDELEYYVDLATSEFSITMKKGGWDCMRHYEIAANATVMAFYRLHRKPSHCAPHGLVDMKNVVAFSSAGELGQKIQFIRDRGLYGELAQASHNWAKSHTCERLAQQVLLDAEVGAGA